MIEWALISWNQCLVFTRAPGFVLYHTIHSHKWTTLNSCRSHTLVFYILDTTDVDHNVEHIMLTYLLILFAPGDAQGCNQWSPVTTIFSDSLHFTPGLSSVFDLSGQSSSPSFLWFSPLSFFCLMDWVHFNATFEMLLGSLCYALITLIKHPVPNMS